MKRERQYTREFGDRIDRHLPTSVVDEMARWGWNALGVYEMVKEQMREHKKIKLPIYQDELTRRPTENRVGPERDQHLREGQPGEETR